MQWLEMEFVVEYFEDKRWNRDSVFTDIVLAEQILNKSIAAMPELSWRLIMVIKQHDAQN
jgi:hypothetical protein